MYYTRFSHLEKFGHSNALPGEHGPKFRQECEAISQMHTRDKIQEASCRDDDGLGVEGCSSCPCIFACLISTKGSCAMFVYQSLDSETCAEMQLLLDF